MHQHVTPKDEIAQFLKTGDSVDTRDDRNNPLMAMEQLGQETHGSTVFGHETLLPVDRFDDKRKALYYKLNYILPIYLKNYQYSERSEIFGVAKDAFESALTDTNRPANDITLWQHSYVTAALTKVFFNHFLIYGEKLNRENAVFSLIGFGWDGLSFISRGHKIGDITGKKTIIKKLKEEIKKVLEYKYPLGMNVYDDDNGMYFVAPAIKEAFSEYEELLSLIIKDVAGIANEITGGEIQPAFTKKVDKTNFLMEIVESINDLKQKSAYPYTSGERAAWMAEWVAGENNTVCAICSKRPVISNNYNICSICRERRVLSQKDREIEQSIFSDEIADKNGRLALLVAKFNLEPWLKGDMLWSLFVKEAKSLKQALMHLGNIEDIKKEDGDRKETIVKMIGKIEGFNYNYEKIKKHIDECKKDTEFGRAISFLFDRHWKELKTPKWEGLKNWVEKLSKRLEIETRFRRKPDIDTFLLTKNHTPSRLLNVWNTTRDFLAEIFNLQRLEDNELISSFRRIRLRLEREDCLKSEYAIYEADVEGKRLELFRDGKNVFLVNQSYKNADIEGIRNEWERRTIRIKASEFEKSTSEIIETKVKEIVQDDKDIYPIRIITTTPDILMAIVPADRAVSLSDYIYDQYKKHFGKVIGRLPFSIGSIFSPKKMPMFIVLDSGRRMLMNFENMNDKYWEKGDEWEVNTEAKKVGNKWTLSFANNIQWHINCDRGSNKPDYFHPYLIVKHSRNNIHTIPNSYQKTFLGDLVHFTEIKEGCTVKVYPNYYDFEFLDSNTRRFDIKFDKDNRRKSNVADFKSKPFLLDELSQKIMCIWDELLKGKQLRGITDTKLRNLQSLWLTKYQEWEVDLSDKSSDKFMRWKGLVTASIQKEFKQINKLQYDLLQETIENGLFFETLELYLGILKERIEEGKEDKGGM